MKTWLLAALLGLLRIQSPGTLPQAADGVIEVLVRDSVTKAPVPGAQVLVAFQARQREVTTDRNGHATFSDLSSGNYRVNVRKEGYVRPRLLTAGQAATLTDTKRKVALEIVLTRGATVKGRVLSPDGKPLAKANVSVQALGWIQGQRAVAPLSVETSEGLTNDRGQYSISGLPTGEYFVSVELRPLLTGQVYSSAFDSLSRKTYYPGVTDASTSIRVFATEGLELGGIDIRIPNLQAYRLIGTVLNNLPANLPAPRGRTTTRAPGFFSIAPADPNSIEVPALLPARLKPTTNPNVFTFEIGGIMPGSYYLYPIYEPDRLVRMSTRSLITVRNHDVENLRLTLEPNPEIKGRVSIRGNSSYGLQNTSLGVRAVERLPALLQRASSAVDARTGEFVFSAFEKGVKFTVSLSDFPPDSYIAELRQGGRSLNTDGILIADPSEGTVEITIDQLGGTLEGTVLKPNGEPQGGATTALVPAPAMRRNFMRYRLAQADPSGNFTLRGIAPGEYKVFAWDAAIGTVAPQNPEFLAPIEARGITVIVGSGTRQTLQLTALPNRP
jgi:hypothetical protein